MKFGNIELTHGLALAPMAGFSDRAMRYVCHLFGAEYSVTEMVSAKAVVYGDEKTFKLARIGEGEGKVAVQIFGSEPDIMAKAGEIIARGQYGGIKPSAIDINMGCPVKKVFSNNEGSALMQNPDLIYKITRAVKESIDIPCTVKMRAGIDEAHINAVECALAAESAGADLLTVHGRTRKQLYSGKSDLEIIKRAKSALKIPVMANGDIVDAESAIYALEYTGADGIMIGRGALGNPFIFKEISAKLRAERYTPPTIKEKCDTALLQLRTAIFEKGENVAVREARGQIALYLKSFRGASRLRADINRALTYRDVEEAFMRCTEYSLEGDL